VPHAPRGIVLLLVLAACGPDGGRPSGTPITVTDDDGRVVHLDAPARRIAVLVPSLTSTTVALGGADRIIARTRWDTDPRLADVPSAGDALTPSVEWLLARRPDLVLVWADGDVRDVARRLTDFGVAVYGARVETIADIDRSIANLGVLLGAGAAADSLRRAIDEGLAEVRTAVSGRPAPAVAYLIGLDPPTVAGPGSYVHELIEIAGARNAFGDLRVRWPPLSLEELVRRQPDVLVVATGGIDAGSAAADLARRPGWRELHAVRSGRVIHVDPGLFNRPGPEIVRAARELAQRLNGERP
jgi:iron complex transport system substrate-binding protein